MNINYFAENYKLFTLKMLYPQKEYVYTCTADNAVKLNRDFIYLPMISWDNNVLDAVANVFSNHYCKGIVLNQKIIESKNLKLMFHLFMKKYSSNLEVILLTNNVYNLTYYLAVELSKQYQFKTVSIIGTSETSTVKEMLVYNLEGKCKITYPQNNWNCWQKLFESVLSADAETEYAIIEAVPEKYNLVLHIPSYYNNHLIFTCSSLYNMNLYKDLDDLSDELVKVFSKDFNVESIWTCIDNEFINSKIPYRYQDRLHFVPVQAVNTFEQDFYYLDYCYSLVYAFLKFQNEGFICGENFKENFALYNEFNYKNSSFFVINKDKISYKCVKATLEVFFKKYPDKKKVVILEHIPNLADFKEPVYSEIFESLACLSPDILVLVNTNKYIHLYKKHNNKTYVKYMPYAEDNTESKLNLEILLSDIISEDIAVYISSIHDFSWIYGGIG